MFFRASTKSEGSALGLYQKNLSKMGGTTDRPTPGRRVCLYISGSLLSTSVTLDTGVSFFRKMFLPLHEYPRTTDCSRHFAPLWVLTEIGVSDARPRHAKRIAWFESTPILTKFNRSNSLVLSELREFSSVTPVLRAVSPVFYWSHVQLSSSRMPSFWSRPLTTGFGPPDRSPLHNDEDGRKFCPFGLRGRCKAGSIGHDLKCRSANRSRWLLLKSATHVKRFVHGICRQLACFCFFGALAALYAGSFTRFLAGLFPAGMGLNHLAFRQWLYLFSCHRCAATTRTALLGAWCLKSGSLSHRVAHVSIWPIFPFDQQPCMRQGDAAIRQAAGVWAYHHAIRLIVQASRLEFFWPRPSLRWTSSTFGSNDKLSIRSLSSQKAVSMFAGWNRRGNLWCLWLVNAFGTSPPTEGEAVHHNLEYSPSLRTSGVWRDVQIRFYPLAHHATHIVQNIHNRDLHGLIFMHNHAQPVR